MYSSKADLDRHVKDIFKRLHSDAERDIKCFSIANQYFKLKEYETAIKYINRYITNVKNNAAAQKLLGNCYEGLKKPSNAFEAYKASLELDGGQKDLVLKVCELLCNPELPLVASQANYWLTRLQGIHPNIPLVFKLKERLIQADSAGQKNPKELESLYISEIIARPDDQAVRIRFFNFLLDTKRVKTAQEQGSELLSRGVFSNSLAWYECLHKVYQAYEETVKEEKSMNYHLSKLTILERASYFTLQDCGTDRRPIADCERAVFNFDQELNVTTSYQAKPRDKPFFQSALDHFRNQLAYHLAILKWKQAKLEPCTWQQSIKTGNPLFLLATRRTNISGHEDYPLLVYWLAQATERVIVSCQVLLAQVSGIPDHFLDQVRGSCGGKWRERTYEKVFMNKEHQDAIGSSNFISNSYFLELPTVLPSVSEMERISLDAQSSFPESLHYLSWLGSWWFTPAFLLKPSFQAQIVSKLPLTVANINNTTAEALNRLDVDAFLYAACFCAKFRLKKSGNSDRPSLLPVSISEKMCTEQQAEWWSLMYQMVTNRVSLQGGGNCEIRLKIRKGIETVRAFGSHGMHPRLLILLAKQFQHRANNCPEEEEKKALEHRAEMYWQAAIPLLERLEKNQTIREVSVKLFDIEPGEFKANAIRTAIEEGKLFIGSRLMDEGRHEEAMETFQGLKSPYATFKQALIYKKMAEEVLDTSSDVVNARNENILLLTKARDALEKAEDRLRGPSVSPNHPLFALIQQELDDIESDLTYAENVRPRISNGTHQTSHNYDLLNPLDGSLLLTGGSPRTPRIRQSLVQSTPRRSEAMQQNASPQIEKLSKQVNELLIGKHDVSNTVAQISSDLGEVKDLLGSLLGEFKKLSVKLADRPLMGDDLFGVPEEENYTAEENSFSTPMQQRLVAQPHEPHTTVPFPQLPHPDSMMTSYCSGCMWGNVQIKECPNMPDFRSMPVPPQSFSFPPMVPFQQPALPTLPLMQPPIQLPSEPKIPNVVVTSSTTLPTMTKTTSPVMSVTIPPEHVRQPPKPVEYGTHPFQISMPPATTVPIFPGPDARQPLYTIVKKSTFPSPPKSSQETEKTLSSTPPREKSKLIFTPPRLTPVVEESTDRSLDTVESKRDPSSASESQVLPTEEDETHLFQCEAILYVFHCGEWKERGRGLVKILHDEETDKVRVLMRRNQVHTICANHHILPGMSLNPMKNQEKAFLWVATDYSEGEHSTKQFSIKFKTYDEAKDFEFAFNKGRQIVREAAQKKINEHNWKVSEESKNVLFTGWPNAEKTKEKDALLDVNKPVFSGSISFGDIAKKESENFIKTNPDFKGFPGAGTPVFGGNLNSSSNKSNVSADLNSSHEDKVEEYEPSVEFAPVVPLPELVDVVTGEEKENILFKHRAKLLRFATETKEWKERGVGDVKLLINPDTNRVRILMRRDQVHKVCCNHHVDENMNFERMKSSPKTATWTALDFTEGEQKMEILAIRFGQVETLNDFLATISDLQKRMKGGVVDGKDEAKTDKKKEIQKPLSEMFKKPASSWECTSCYISNNENSDKCVCCETPRPGNLQSKASGEDKNQSASNKQPLSELFKKPAGSWDCPNCLVRNDVNSNQCKCCETARDVDQSRASDTTPKTTPAFSFGIPKLAVTSGAPTVPTSESSGFAFGATTPTSTRTTASSSSFTFDKISSSPASTFSFGGTTATPTATNFTFGSMSFSFGVPKTTEPSSTATFAFGSSPAGPAKTFSFGIPDKEVVGSSPSSELKLGSSEKFKFTFKKGEETKTVKSPGSADDRSDSETEDLEREDENISFKPVIPLPEKVPLTTGEEDEDVVYCHRAKLFRHIDGDWKERGVGDLKILKNKQTGKVRFVMRRDQVLKVCLNQYLTKDFTLSVKDDRSWMWKGADYSEGNLSWETFAVRFRDKEIAQAFKQAVDREVENFVDSPTKDESEQQNKNASASKQLFVEEQPEVVYEYKSSPEQLKEARKLQLPDNWYRYEEAEPCPGCVGCEKDGEGNETVKSEKENKKFEVIAVKVNEESVSTKKVEEKGDKENVFTKKIEEKEDEQKVSPSKVEEKEDEQKVSPSKVEEKEDEQKVSPSKVEEKEDEQKVSPSKVEEKKVQEANEPIKLGLLPKPSETIFGSQAKPPSPLKENVAPETTKPSLFSTFSFKAAEPSGFTGSKSTEPAQKPLFGSPIVTNTPIFGSNFNPSSGSIFGGSSTPTSYSFFGGATDSKPIFGNTSGSIFSGAKTLNDAEPIFNAPENLSFSSLAKSSATSTFGFGGSPGWKTEVVPVFSRQTEKEKDDSETDSGGEEEEHDPQFKPIIALPEVVEVRTGEEGEEKLFCERAKLFRYSDNTSEWKERGVGEMKVLHSREHGSYRLLLRREQVHKVVCNMRINPGFELKPLTKSPNSWIFVGMNFAEEEGANEKLAVKFKTETEFENFKSCVDSCIRALMENSTAEKDTADPLQSSESAEGYYENYDEDGDEEDDEGETLVFSSNNVTLNKLENNAVFNMVAAGLNLQVYEGSDGGYRVILEEEGKIVCHSHIYPGTNEEAIKILPASIKWTAPDWSSEDESNKTFKIDFQSAGDAQQLYEIVGATD